MPVFAFVYSFVYSQLLVMLASFCSLLPTCRLQASSSCCRLRGDEPIFLAFSKHNKSHVSLRRCRGVVDERGSRVVDVTVDRRSSTSEGGGPASLLRWQNIHHHSVSTKKSRRAARCCQWFSRRLLECACVRACMHLASAHAPLCAFFSRNLSPCLARWSKLLDAMYMEIITPCTSIGHHHTRLRSTPYPRNNQSRSSWTLIKPNKAGRPPCRDFLLRGGFQRRQRARTRRLSNVASLWTAGQQCSSLLGTNRANVQHIVAADEGVAVLVLQLSVDILLRLLSRPAMSALTVYAHRHPQCGTHNHAAGHARESTAPAP